MPAKKKTTPTNLRKHQSSNVDELPVKCSRRGQNNNNNDNKEDPTNGPTARNRPRRPREGLERGGSEGTCPKVRTPIIDDNRLPSIRWDLHPHSSLLTISTGKPPRTAIARMQGSDPLPSRSKPRTYPLPSPFLSFYCLI